MVDRTTKYYIKNKAEAIKQFRKKIPKFAKKVAPLYQQLNWEWKGVTNRIPNEEDIKNTLFRLLGYLEEENGLGGSTGGLNISEEVCPEMETVSYKMSFEVSEHSYEE